MQSHIGRLPVAYYDANKTGTLVARIMTDVEGIRNLLGTGLIEFAGGVLTAVLVLGYLLRLSWLLTVDRSGHHGRIRPRFCARRSEPSGPFSASAARSMPKSRAGSPNRWAACAWSRATMPRRAKRRCFAAGVQRLLDNVLKSSDRDLGDESFGHGADGRGGRAHHVRGRAPDSGQAR